MTDNVKSIGANAFANCSSLSSVKFSSSVDIIPSGCFDYCKNLKNFDIPNSVTTIKNIAFRGAGLESVDLSRVTTVESQAFFGCKLKTIEFGSVLESLGPNVFRNCTMLTNTNLILPDSLTTMGEGCFRGTNIRTITLGTGITSLPKECFLDCKGLTSVTSNSDGVTDLGEGCFSGCTALTSVNLKNDNWYTLTSIGDYAFQNCSSLYQTIFLHQSNCKYNVDLAFEGSHVTVKKGLPKED